MKVLAGLGAAVLGATSGALAAEWIELTPASGPVPPARELSTSIYDPASHRMLVFGGAGASGNLNDVWAFDLTSHVWSNLTPAAGPMPGPRLTPVAVYDAAGGRMLVWSGRNGATFFNDVWAFDLTSATWTELVAVGPEPNPRYGTASVFDPVAQDLVTFAGFTNAGRFEDTWRLGTGAVAWTEVSMAATPGRRCLHSASYDIANRRMIVYGGQSSGPLGDIWALDLATNTWTDLTPASSPAARYFTTHAHDAMRGRALVFAGHLEPASSNEAWAFDLAAETWQLLQPSGTPPSPRYGAAGIYVVTEDRMIVFGGTAVTFENDVWSLDFADPDGVVFPGPITADGDDFRWTVPANMLFVRGDLGNVATYAHDVVDSAIHATSFTDTAVPPAGSGYYYLVRLAGDRGTWQTAVHAEPQRDLSLP